MKVELKIICDCGCSEVIDIKRYCDFGSEYCMDKEFTISMSVDKSTSNYTVKTESPEGVLLKCSNCGALIDITT